MPYSTYLEKFNVNLAFCRALFALTVLSLTACIAPPSYNTDRQYSSANEINRWQAQGKLGIRLPSESKAVNFVWQQDDDDFKIQLHGTLGLGNISLEQKKDKATLQTADGKRTAPSAETLIEDALGVALPVSALHHWMKGVATPDFSFPGNSSNNAQAKIEFNEDGTLKSLQQDNWQVEYRTYHPADPIALPRKIVVVHQETRITLVIKNWEY